MKAKDLFGILREAMQEFGRDRAAMLGAALAYYTIFSIGPLLLIITGIVGLVFGNEASSGKLAESISGALGSGGAETIQSIVAGASSPGAGIVSTVTGTATLLLGAMGLFGQLKNALNMVWNVPFKKRTFVENLKANAGSFVMLLLSALILLLSLVVNAVLAQINRFWPDLPGSSLLWQIINYAVSLAILTLMFAMIFRVLPDKRIAWKDVWLGAAFTSVLFVLGQVLLSIYFSLSDPGSAFGAAGSLVALLVWIYYTAQIILFGAEVTQVYAAKFGTHVSPERQRALDRMEREERRRAAEAKGERLEGATEEPQSRQSPWFS